MKRPQRRMKFVCLSRRGFFHFHLKLLMRGAEQRREIGPRTSSSLMFNEHRDENLSASAIKIPYADYSRKWHEKLSCDRLDSLWKGKHKCGRLRWKREKSRKNFLFTNFGLMNEILFENAREKNKFPRCTVGVRWERFGREMGAEKSLCRDDEDLAEVQVIMVELRIIYCRIQSEVVDLMCLY